MVEAEATENVVDLVAGVAEGALGVLFSGRIGLASRAAFYSATGG